MTGWLELLFDAGLAVLLAVTIGYCARLSSRIRLLQDSRSELAGMIAQFDQATSRAMTSLAELQTVSKRITDALQLKIEKANFLADDLAFLIEKSNKLASELDTRKPALPKAPAPQEVAALFEPEPAVPPSASSFRESSESAEAEAQARSNASLEALLARLSVAGTTAGTPSKITVMHPPAPRPDRREPARTEAERELYEALKGR